MENVRSENHRGAAMEGVKLASEAAANTNRRALRDIKNILGAPHNPQAVSKRGLQEKRAATGAAILQQSQPANAPRWFNWVRRGRGAMQGGRAHQVRRDGQGARGDPRCPAPPHRSQLLQGDAG